MFWWLLAAAGAYAYSKLSEPKSEGQSTAPAVGQRQLPERAAGNRMISTEREAAAARPALIAKRAVTENETKVLTRAELDDEARRMQNWVRSEFYKGNNAGGGKAVMLNDLKTQPSPNVVTFNRLPLVQPAITRLELPSPALANDPALKAPTPELMRIAPAVTSEEPARMSEDVMKFLAGGVRKGGK